MTRKYLVEITGEKEAFEEKELLKVVISGFCEGYFGEESEVSVKSIVPVDVRLDPEFIKELGE